MNWILTDHILDSKSTSTNMSRHIKACTKNFAKGKVDLLVKFRNFHFFFDYGQRINLEKAVESFTRRIQKPMFQLNSMESRWTIRFAKLNVSNFRMTVPILLYIDYFSSKTSATFLALYRISYTVAVQPNVFFTALCQNKTHAFVTL